MFTVKIVINIILLIIMLMITIRIGDGIEKSERLYRMEYARLKHEVDNLKKRISELEGGS